MPHAFSTKCPKKYLIHFFSVTKISRWSRYLFQGTNYFTSSKVFSLDFFSHTQRKAFRNKINEVSRFLAFTFQQNSQCGNWYHTAKSVTETQRNRQNFFFQEKPTFLFELIDLTYLAGIFDLCNAKLDVASY